jgi:hypothetical protein
VSRSVSYCYQARIRLYAPARKVAERIPPTAGLLEAHGERACILRAGAESLDVLAIYVTLIGVEFAVATP